MDWKKIVEENIDQASTLPFADRITLLEMCLRNCAEAFDRIESSIAELRTT